MSTTRVTVCELDTREERREEELAALAAHCRERSSDVLLLPEMPFSPWLAAAPEPDAGAWRRSVAAHADGVRGLSAVLPATAVVATRPTAEGRAATAAERRNQAFTWTAATGAVGWRDKRYLPQEEGFWEESWYAPGRGAFDVVELVGARLGVQVCTEVWFFERARRYADLGVELLCVPRATPATSTSTWLAGGRAAAVSSGAYCLSSNHASSDLPGRVPAPDAEDPMRMGGLGWVVSPDGDVLATTSPEEPFVTVEVDLDVARAAKGTYPRYVRG